MIVNRLQNQLVKGFTLVELMVSMVVTLLIISLLVYVTAAAFDALAEGTDDITSGIKSQQTLDQLASDLEVIVIPHGRSFQALAAVAGNTDNVDNTLIASGAVSPPNGSGYYSNLTFLTAALDRYDGIPGNPGDVSCVEYAISYQDPINNVAGSAPTYVLYRNIINPNDTFNSIIGMPTGVDANGNPVAPDIAAAASTFRGGGIDVARNVLCENIRELTLTFHVEYSTVDNNGNVTKAIAKLPVMSVGAGSGGVNDYKVSDFRINGNGIQVDGANLGANVAATAAEINAGRVVAIDINAQVISKNVVPLLAEDANPNIQLKVEQGTKRFSKTIYIPQM